MTAGRLFRVSPPMEGSKFTHHTSPRLVGYIPHGPLCPLQSLGLALLVPRHLLVRLFEVSPRYLGADQIFDESADPAPSDHGVKTLVHLLIEGYRELLLQGGPSTCGTRVASTLNLAQVRGASRTSL